MIKKHFEQVIKEEEVIDEILCNCCGKPIKRVNASSIIRDHLHIKKEWNYFSNNEGQKYELDICEDCCGKILSTFKIKPGTSNSLDNYDELEKAYTEEDYYNQMEKKAI